MGRSKQAWCFYRLVKPYWQNNCIIGTCTGRLAGRLAHLHHEKIKEGASCKMHGDNCLFLIRLSWSGPKIHSRLAGRLAHLHHEKIKEGASCKMHGDNCLFLIRLSWSGPKIHRHPNLPYDREKLLCLSYDRFLLKAPYQLTYIF
ncbi:hypothetical protein KP509_38G062700 [Ceratopteris richardii]|uniref:Uncharacterized protein n=1 Tax=Ceratopteris richardii TaxID=49495 RepID=A0A8T2Q5A3_CERRI|nr:hypothetical protein KP509_38G062700 [Ceratopteris richardii]